MQLCAYLKELALEWYFANIRGYEIEWTQAKETFIEQFGINEKPDLNKLLDKVWDVNNESINQYYQRKLIECRKAGIGGRILLQILTRGLPERMKHWVNILGDDATPSEWFKLVSNAYSNQSAEAKMKHHKSVSINNFEDNIQEQLKKGASRPPMVHTDNEVTQSKKCTHCGKDNHKMNVVSRL